MHRFRNPLECADTGARRGGAAAGLPGPSLTTASTHPVEHRMPPPTPEFPDERQPAHPAGRARYELDPPFEWSPATIGVGAVAIVLVLLVALFPSVAASAVDQLAELL